MSLLLDEYDWTENIIADHNLGNKPIETLKRVSKYYRENKYDKKETRALLNTFMLRCDPQVSLVLWSNTLDKIANKPGKRPLIRLDGVDISKKEMKHIGTLSNIRARRLAFTLLCAAKYWDCVSADNNHWVNSPDREIMKMANINTTVKKQCLLFADLREAGLIRFAKKIDNLNVQVTFMEPGQTAIHIQDFRNLGYQCHKYFGGAYFHCANCGLTVKMPTSLRGRPPKYCPACASDIKIQQGVKSVRRSRKCASK